MIDHVLRPSDIGANELHDRSKTAAGISTLTQEDLDAAVEHFGGTRAMMASSWGNLDSTETAKLYRQTVVTLKRLLYGYRDRALLLRSTRLAVDEVTRWSLRERELRHRKLAVLMDDDPDYDEVYDEWLAADHQLDEALERLCDATHLVDLPSFEVTSLDGVAHDVSERWRDVSPDADTDAGLESCLRKLVRDVGELLGTSFDLPDNWCLGSVDLAELPDVVLGCMLIGSYTAVPLSVSCADKLELLHERRYVRLPDGTYQHAKESQ